MDTSFAPLDPDEARRLARLAGDETAPRADRDRALRALGPLIQEVAESVARGFRGQIAQDLRDEAVSCVGEALPRFDPEREGTLTGWIRAVLYNHGAETRRKRRHSRKPLDRACTGGDHGPAILSGMADRRTNPDENGDPGERLAAFGRRTRRALNAAFRPHSSRGVDYHAVLLVQVRLRYAARILRSYDGLPPQGDVAEKAEELVPWDEHEKVRCFRPGCPAIEPLWQALARRLDEGHTVLKGPLVCETVRQMTGQENLVTEDQWYQWVYRTRARAKDLLEPDDWNVLFEPWI